MHALICTRDACDATSVNRGGTRPPLQDLSRDFFRVTEHSNAAINEHFKCGHVVGA